MRRLPLLLGLSLLSACAGNGTPGRKYVVFFTRGSTAIEASAARVIRTAAATANTIPDQAVYVEAYAAAHGNLSADEMLAVERANRVTTELERDGVAAARIHATPRPPTNEDPSVGARRVEISVGEGR